MNNSKLINILRTFSKSEMKEFEKFISSPYFNKGRNYIPFFNELKKFYPKFDSIKLNPEYIHTKLYPGKRFNRQVIWNMTSALFSLSEEFLLNLSVDKDRFSKNIHISNEYYERKLSLLFQKKLGEMERELAKAGIGSSYFQNKAALESYESYFHFLEDKQHLVPPHIVKRGEYAILDFLRVISGVIGDMSSNKRMFNARFDVNLPNEFVSNLRLDKVIEYAKKNKFALSGIMEMYYCSIKMTISPGDTSDFMRLIELYEENSEKFTPDERVWWLTALTNYCVDFSLTDKKYRKTLFEINKMQLKEIEHSKKKELGKILFIQILRNSLYINEVSWTQRYIDKFIPFLKRSYQKSMRALANSFLNFKLKDYNKVIDNLKTVTFIDTRDKLFVRSLYLMSYYELNDIAALLYQIDSAKHFINKNTSITENTKLKYNIFLNFLNRLAVLKENKNINELEQIRTEIAKNQRLINGEWLVEKADEILKS